MHAPVAIPGQKISKAPYPPHPNTRVGTARSERKEESRSSPAHDVLKVLFTPDEAEPWLRVHVALDVQLAAEDLGPAEEDARLPGSVDLADAAEHHVPVGAAEVGRGAQARDGVARGVGVIYHDVRRVVGFYIGCEVLCSSGILSVD